MKKTFSILASYLLFTSSLSIASNHDAIIVKKMGMVEVLSNPSKTVSGQGPHVLFEGSYYNIGEAKIGQKIQNGTIIRTGKEGKAKIVYKNGDQLNIGIGSAYKVTWMENTGNKKQDPSTLNLMYGSLRGIVDKEGPRSGMQVKTRNAVMGVRGTDFNVSQKGTSGESGLNVLRGKVMLTEVKNPEKKLEVKTGFSAEVNESQNTMNGKNKNVVVANLVQTSKSDLAEILKESSITKTEAKKEEVSLEVSKEIQALEKKATDVTLKDIKTYEPALYEEIKKANIQNVDAINAMVVKEAVEKAPAKKVKPGVDNINFDSDAYKKYFDIKNY